VWKIFEHESHIPKEENMSLSIYVREHFICELQLKEYCVATSSGSALKCGQGLLAVVW
jgi:hypothetical protein